MTHAVLKKATSGYSIELTDEGKALAPGVYLFVAQQASATPPAPTDTIRVACITLDGSTLTVPVTALADVVPDLISESGDVYTLTLKTMTVAEYEALGEFNGF